MDSSDSDEMYVSDEGSTSDVLSDSDETIASEEIFDSGKGSNYDETSVSDKAYLRKMVYPFTRAEFLKSYLKQSFSLPDSLIYYIAKNPPNPEMYEKLIQTCKHFFITNPIIVVTSCTFHVEENDDDGNKWYTSFNTYFNRKSVNFDEILSKLWITNDIEIYIEWFNENLQNFALPFSKIYRCDAKKCDFMDLDISFKDFMLITPKCEGMQLRTVTVTNDDGSVVPVEKIVEALPHLTSFFYDFCEMSVENIAKVVTPATVENLIQIPHFSTLKIFTLFEVPESFDIQRFFAHIKKNKTTHMNLEFDYEISEEYATSIRAMVQEIIHTDNHDYDIPWIYSAWMNVDLYDGLLAISTRRYF